MGWNFADELARHGPHAGDRVMPLAEARAYCRRVTRASAENFTVASWLLPRRLVPHFEAIYAYCRWADDLGDETGGGAKALALLDWWRAEFLAVYSGRPWHPVMVALRETVREFDIPPEPFLNLLVAFAQDQHVREYATFGQLLGYCRNSANPVGQLVLRLFRCHTPERATLSDEVCTGLQLANFWQDVARDWGIGRIYVPAEDRERFGVTPADWQAQACTPPFRELMRFQVERTEQYFRRGEPLLETLPREARIDVELFLRGGRAVLAAIERQDYDVWSARPRVSKYRKARLLGGAVMASLFR